MALVVDVPLNTMLADLDESLRALLKRELARHGFDGVEVAFDAPDERLVEPALGADRQPLPLRPARVAPSTARRVAPATRQRPAPRDAPAAAAWSAPTRSRPGRRRSRTSTGCCRRCSASCSRSRAARRRARRPLLETARSASRSRAAIGQPKADGKADFWSPSAASTRRRSTTSSRSRASPASRSSAAPRCARRRSRRALSDGAGRHDHRDAPLRRQGHRRRRRAASPTPGSRCPSSGCSAVDRRRTGRFRLRPRPGRASTAASRARRDGARGECRARRARRAVLDLVVGGEAQAARSRRR